MCSIVCFIFAVAGKHIEGTFSWIDIVQKSSGGKARGAQHYKTWRWIPIVPSHLPKHRYLCAPHPGIKSLTFFYEIVSSSDWTS